MPYFDDDDDFPESNDGPSPAPAAPVEPAEPAVDYFSDLDTLALSTGGLERAAPEKGQAVRLAIIPASVCTTRRARNHFLKSGSKRGTYICLTQFDAKGHTAGKEAICCQKLNGDEEQSSKYQFAALVVAYSGVGKNGRYPKGTLEADVKAELQWLRLSLSGLKSILKLCFEGEAVDAFDFIMTMKDNGVGYDYARASVAKWKTLPALSAAILADAAAYKDGSFLTKRLGKRITSAEFAALIGTPGTRQNREDGE